MTNAILGDPMRLYNLLNDNNKSESFFDLLPNIQLERLEFTTDSGTSRTFPPSALFGHENIYTGLADTTDTFSAGIALLQLTYALTGCAVYLNGLR